MKRFKNVKTGIIENVTNEKLLDQYENNKNYVEVKEEKPVKNEKKSKK